MPQVFTGLSDGADLGVCCWIMGGQHTVRALSDNLVMHYNHSTGWLAGMASHSIIGFIKLEF
jgi:hypothetical protein